ncbi:MAG: HAD family hydrolase [Gemmatimonadaceae bacterium]
MPYGAVIFDIDGTLVDTNDAHVRAWAAAFRKHGEDVTPDRIAPEIGKGGDKLVPALLGARGEEKLGDALRASHAEAFLSIAARTRFRVFPRAEDLLAELRRRGTPTALATSSDKRFVDAVMRSAGVDLRDAVDHIVTADDAKESKPAPDIVQAAVKKLGVPARDCIMLGDTPHDAEACRRAGVAFAALTSGGNTADELRAAGACGIWRDTAQVLELLDRLLDDCDDLGSGTLKEARQTR